MVRKKHPQNKEKRKESKKASGPNAARIVSRESRIFAILAYIPFLFFIPLILKRSDAFVRFHVQQGIVVFLFELLVMFLAGIPVIGWFLIGPVGWIGVLFFALSGIVHVMNDEEKQLPLIGRYAKRVNV